MQKFVAEGVVVFNADKVLNWIGIKILALNTWLLKQETLKNHAIEFEPIRKISKHP
jgi:hypothetical protein